MQLAHGFSYQASRFTLSKGAEFTPHVSTDFTPHNLAELLKEKIPPKIVDGKTVTQPYEIYLNALKDYERASHLVSKANKALALIDVAPASAVDAKALAELRTALENVDQNTMSMFQSESRAAATGIGRTQYHLQGKPKSYFNDFSTRNDGIYSFAQARAIQLNEDIPKVPVDSGFSTSEEVIHALPLNLDLTTEFYRYSLIKDFEEVLIQGIKPKAEEILKTAAEQRIEEFLKTPSLLGTNVKSYISKLGEDDYARFFGEPPASLYTKLARTPTSEEQILYALDNYKRFLDEADYNKLLEASRYHRTLRRALNLIKNPQEGQEPKSEDYIKKLVEFESQAFDNRGINYPYLEDLFLRGMIDDATHAKLNSPGITLTSFHNLLGTPQQFTQTLMDQFRKTLEAQTLKQVANNDLLDIASTHLTQSYFEALDSRAKKIYLTTDAFTKPESMNFDRAIGVYDESALREFLSLPPDHELVAKALVEAHLPEATPADELEAFLNEVHTPGHLPKDLEVKDDPILEHIPGIDYRLREFFEKPLMKGDVRLKGTRYAQMSDKAITKLNAAAYALFNDYEKLNEAAKSNPQLVDQIVKLEAQLHEDIPPMLEVMDFIYRNKDFLPAGEE